MNLIGFATFIINGITGILFCFIIDISPGISFILSGIMWLSPIYMNRNGLTIVSRVLLVLCTLLALFLASCWYTHDTMLDSFFLIVAINSNFMFSTKERKWALASTSIALILFIIESTSLQNYLPAYNTLAFTPAINYILLFSVITNIWVDLSIYSYINHLRETNLFAKKKQLEETQYKVQIQNEDLKTFSIAASHSMQTPLHVSSYFLEKVKSEMLPIATEDAIQNIELIENGLNQIDMLVSGLFSYNRIINIENERNRFDVVKEIELIKKNIIPKYSQGNIVVNFPNLFITTNQLLFSIIMYNLIDNGLKYNRSDIPEVKITFYKKDRQAIFLIGDNGIGIPVKFFSVIFEPFKRIPAHAKIKSGNGLGLAGAKRAAERIGGNLVCEKSDHNGTIFRLEIPLM